MGVEFTGQTVEIYVRLIMVSSGHPSIGTEDGEVVETEDVTEEATGQIKEKKSSELISANVALVHLMKGNIGIGVLAMPSALVNAGLAVVAVITIHCMHMLVNATHVLTDRHNSVYLDY